jgi:hypothetical protein
VRSAESQYSRNRDAADVPLDGPAVTRVVERMLRRAGVIAGERGRGYLEERLKRFTDVWTQLRMPNEAGSLGYEAGAGGKGESKLRPLLLRAGAGKWGDQTVAMSMRETENEVNLLVPADLQTPSFGDPPWTFAPRDPDDTRPGDEDLRPEGDELGESALSTRKAKS